MRGWLLWPRVIPECTLHACKHKKHTCVLLAALLERPWLKDGALVPPAGTTRPAKGATRKRPFIYVYDAPAYAAARMLQYRSPK